MVRSVRLLLGGAATAAAIIATVSGAPSGAAAPRGRTPADIETHDNSQAAGMLATGVLSVSLVAAEGRWFPEARGGPAHVVYAFGEEGRPLRNPGPLLRVPVGTEIRATIRNDIGERTLTVHGLHDRPGRANRLSIAPGDTAHVRFRVTAPGTYLYWATTRDAATLVDRFGKDGQLVGALIVDPPEGPADDRVFVIGISEDSAAGPAQRHLRAAVVNGRSWPHAAIHTVSLGDTVRMRWINASSRFHPMHLHGSYFRVDGRGDIAADTIYTEAGRRLAVTEMMVAGSTMALTWVPEREGNWLLHCHAAAHMSPELRGGPRASHDAGHAPNHAMDVMSGLVTGWRVVGPEPSTGAPNADAGPPRRIRLLVHSSPRRYGDAPALGFVVQTGAVPPPEDSVSIPGPPLVVTRGKPVEITVVNRLDEPTSIHWHGIELDSYFDGVSGWSGSRTRISPPVAARDSFVVRFTPPRAGTFMYHSHFDEERQLASGLYGPLLVMEPGRRFDPDADRPWVLSQQLPVKGGSVLLNGASAPVVDLVRGRTYRIRLLNIATSIPLTFAVLEDSVPVRWRAVAKDGADLPPHQAVERPAVLQIGVGEAYDFVFIPQRTGTLRITARGPFGPIRLTGKVRVRD
jgi:FtsP/CotA-like multicopper oxidase with cupredoxin domain